MKYYPINLDLARKRCVVVGGGSVAERKVNTLLDYQAAVTLIAPWITPGLSELAESGKITHVSREYQTGDLEGAALVIGATNDRSVNSHISSEAEEENILVNIVDDPALCNFIVPATVVRGDIVLSVSTGGAAPALAKRLREILEEAVGPEFGEMAALMGKLRPEVKEQIPDEEERSRVWLRILESDVLDLIRQGKPEEAEKRARECISS